MYVGLQNADPQAGGPQAVGAICGLCTVGLPGVVRRGRGVGRWGLRCGASDAVPNVLVTSGGRVQGVWAVSKSGLVRFEGDGGKREGVHRGVLGAPWGCMMRSWGRRGAAWGRFARQDGFPSTVNISQHQSTSVNISQHPSQHPVNIQST